MALSSKTLNELEQVDRLQAEIYARLGSDPFFVDVPIILVRPGLIVSDVAESLGVLNQKSGKMGVVVLVHIPSFESRNGNSSGLQGFLVPMVRVLENEEFNSGPTGTGKTHSMIAMRGARVCQQYMAQGVWHVMTVDKKAVTPYTRDLAIGIVGSDVTWETAGGLTGGDKVATPAISGTPDAVTLTCATAGASIYYTTDGSYPGSGNVDANGNLLATLYTVPFTVPGGTFLRAGAETADLVPANTASFQF